MAMLNHQSISISDASRIAIAMAKVGEVPFFLAQCGIGKSTISHASMLRSERYQISWAFLTLLPKTVRQLLNGQFLKSSTKLLN